MSGGASHVTVRFGAVTALDDISLDVPAGQITGVVGGDGAGKTSLLRALAGVLPVTSGEVRRPDSRAVGYFPASTGTYPDLSVEENLEFAATAYGLPSEEARHRASSYLDRTGLADFRDRLAGRLSGGMRQKLGVIRAMLHRPELLILDEPTTGIDPVSRVDLWWLLGRAAAEGAAVVFSSTYLDEAERVTQLLVLDGGRPLASGTPDEIIAATPGSLRLRSERPSGGEVQRSWRRRAVWRVWEPEAEPSLDQRVPLDLQDAVTVRALQRELAQADTPPSAPGDSGPTSANGAVPQPRSGSTTSPTSAPLADGSRITAAPRTSGPLVRSGQVTRQFGDFVAVDRVDLEVHPGEVVGLLGANGSGKTTLIRMLLGLLPPTAGGVSLFGRPPSRETRRRLGYVPQSLGLYDDLTATENLAFGRAIFGGGDSAPSLDELLREGARDTLVGHLSLGIQRRVAFAEALGHRPDLLVLDEPTSGVDPLARARLWETVRGSAEAGAGVLVTTHYMEEAEECDRLVVLAAGRVVARGTAREITGDATVTVVESEVWAECFEAVEKAGFRAALVGRSLRVPGAVPAQIEQALGDLPSRVQVQVTEAPATFEERFFQLVSEPASASAES